MPASKPELENFFAIHIEAPCALQGGMVVNLVSLGNLVSWNLPLLYSFELSNLCRGQE